MLAPGILLVCIKDDPGISGFKQVPYQEAQDDPAQSLPLLILTAYLDADLSRLASQIPIAHLPYSLIPVFYDQPSDCFVTVGRDFICDFLRGCV